MRPPSRMPIGVPVASGAILVTASMKRLSTALSLESPLGLIETRARPSAVIQSRDHLRRQDCRVTGCGGERVRGSGSSMVVSGGISVCGAPWRASPAGPSASRSSAPARRSAWAAAGSRRARGAWRRSAAVCVRLLDHLGVARRRAGDERVEGRGRAAWRRRRSSPASAAWSAGTKSARVRALATSGSLLRPRRRAPGRPARIGRDHLQRVRRLVRVAHQVEQGRRPTRPWGSRRWIGLKSKLQQRQQRGADQRPPRRAVPSTQPAVAEHRSRRAG